MNKNYLGYIWSILAVPFIFAISVYFAYDYALERGLLPTNMYPRYLWYILFSVLIISGLLPIVYTKFKNMLVKVVSVIFYICIMSITLFYIHLEVACRMGDCLWY